MINLLYFILAEPEHNVQPQGAIPNIQLSNSPVKMDNGDNGGLPLKAEVPTNVDKSKTSNVGNSGLDVKKADNIGDNMANPESDSEEMQADDVPIQGPFTDPGITCSGVNIPLNSTTLPSGITSYSFTVSCG